jgi:diguanylate cyclase (GGDEF)-like protein
MSSEHPRLPGRRPSARLHAILVEALIVVIGLCASLFLASEWRSSALRTNSRSFAVTVADLSDTLGAKINSDVALTHSLRAIATMEPHAGQTRFAQWYAQLERDSGSSRDFTAVLTQRVSAARLGAFQRAVERDPAFRALTAGKFKIFPAGHRASYCLPRAIVGIAPTASSVYPPLLDYCAPTLPGVGPSPYPALIRNVTDTGGLIVTPLAGLGRPALVAIGEAVYRRGAPLGSVAARRAATTGVIGTSFDSTALLESVFGSRHSLTLTLYHRNVGGELQQIGRASTGNGGRSHLYSARHDLGGGWLVQVSGMADDPVPALAHGLLALCLGVLITTLVFFLYRVLSRSRRRAWGVVGQKTDELEYHAVHDQLTDLPNRTLVLDRAEQLLARAQREDVPASALLVDVDNFKQVNDRFGHEAGDVVLRQVGARLKSILRNDDTVGRLGADAFVMLLDAVGLDVAPELVAERILDVLRQPITLTDAECQPLSLTASIGIATGRPDSPEDLLNDAALAVKKAKAAGGDGYAKFEFAMQTAAQDRIHLEMDLVDALDANQLFVVYQPILELEDETITGVEALLRWRHPRIGVVAPDQFIPVAEANGLIIPIGRWVLEQACAQGLRWRDRGHPLRISVNVSTRQLERPEFVEEARAVLQRTGFDPAMLTLEITETVLMREPETTARLLVELKALGIRIAVDDFGTGYSSLAYLRQFPVDSLKIDRTFVTGLGVSSEANALAHTLIQLGQALRLQTVAEGVENALQMRELRREGCDLVQGFLFARPLAAAEIDGLLDAGTALPTRPASLARALIRR